VTRKNRLIFLYVILALCVLGIAFPLIKGQAPSEGIIGVLGTIAGYLFLGAGKDSKGGDDEEGEKS
jgi:membrane-bound ClpP family serine protease